MSDAGTSRKWWVLVVTGGLTAVLAVTLLAPVSSASAAKAPGDTQITVFDVEGPYEKDVDLGEPGFGPGDVVFEIQPLIDPVDQSPAGKVYTRIQVMRLLKSGDFVFFLDCEVQLADGNILFNGPAKFSDFDTGAIFPVTGGTGTYALARGTLTALSATVGGKDGATLTFDLTTT